MPKKTTTKNLKKKLTRRPKSPIKPLDLLGSGSTLVNLACSGHIAGAFPKGKYVYFVGSSTSGKTWLALTCFAEAMMSSTFADYDIVYDNVEDGALMDLKHYFGSKVAKRLRPPAMEDGEPRYSETIEEFFYHVDDQVKKGKPFIYVLDSMDALSSEAEDEAFSKNRTAHKKGTKEKGSFGDGKAKKNSQGLRRILKGLRRLDSILIIISQERDNIGFGAQFNPKTHAGGRALKFYCAFEIWTSLVGKIKKTINGVKRSIGVKSQVKITKNRMKGKDHTVIVPIYYSHGIDDVGSCVDYLLEEKRWKQVKGNIKATDFDFVGSRDKLIRKIENEDLEGELRLLVAEVWNEIEDQTAIRRKPRYT